MIDLHCHILPGFDDGAANMEEALDMAYCAAESGTSVIAATPHQNIPGRPILKKGEYQESFRRLSALVKARNSRIQLVPGMEIFATADVAEKLENGSLITLNHTQYPLVEFDFGTDDGFLFYITEKLLKKGYTPIIAHPERYEVVAQYPQIVYDLYRMGAVIQINKGSAMGAFGRRIQRVCGVILEHRLAAIAASDAHSPYSRTPEMAYFAEYLDQNFGEGCSPLLLEENPRRILEGKPIFWESPIPFD